MYTAEDARAGDADDLDARIKNSVENRRDGNGAHIRIQFDDPVRYTIKEELEKRGFKNVEVPDICLCGDVWFEW